MNKNILKRIQIGIKKGFLTPTLPDEILKIQSNPLIRIIRFLGGISFLYILSKNYINHNIYLLYISIILALVFTIYHLILSYYRIKHIITIIKSDKLDIKNSPLDRLATLSAKALLCFKGACETAQPISLTLGLMLGADEILKNANREPIFAPFLGSIINKVLPENTSKDSTRLIYRNMNQLEENIQELKTKDSLLENFRKLNLKGDISKAEFEEFQKLLHDNKQSLLNENQQIKSKILEELEKSKK